MICIITYTKIGSLALSIQALQPNIHISLPTYKHLAHQPINIITIQQGLSLGVLQDHVLRGRRILAYGGRSWIS
jgi:hypothetical protein